MHSKMLKSFNVSNKRHSHGKVLFFDSHIFFPSWKLHITPQGLNMQKEDIYPNQRETIKLSVDMVIR